MQIAKKFLPSSLLLAASLVVVTGCAATAEPAPSEAVPAGDAITIEDAWVKAADEGMSAAFGILENTGETDATVVSVASEASAMIELHETVESDSGELVMREVDGGFTIPAGGELVLEPGANHIMLMDLAGPLLAGDEAVFTLTFSDDSTLEFTAPVKDYAGANENYHEDNDHDHEGSGH